MCRSIKKLRLPDGRASCTEIEAAALQYVRKVSGYRQPSRVNSDAFQTAVRKVADATEQLLGALEENQRRRAAG